MYILLIPLLCYTFLILGMISVLFLNRSPAAANIPHYPVSIVIPFRNEQKHLRILLKSLQQQSYDGQLEILLINDGSTDQSLNIIQEIKKFSRIEITVLDSQFDPASGLTSKQQALDFGINHAKYDWIALTDADMQLMPDWLSSLMACSGRKADMVFGHTSIITDKSIFSKIQAFQLDFLFSAAYVFFKAGISGSCMGNNILISKQAYQKAGGQKAIGYNIAEDRALLELFRQKKMSISCTNPFFPLALTFPCEEWNQFFHQIRRWAKGGIVWCSSLFFIGLLFSLQNLLFLLACFMILPRVITSIALMNFLFTWLFTAVSFKRIGSSQKFFYFPLFLLFLLFEAILFSFSSLYGSEIKWKGRKLDK